MTITCTELVEVVTDYLEGQVDDSLRAEIEAHLALCPGCDNYLEQMRETIRLSGMVTEEQVPEDEKTALLAAFRDWRS